MAAAAEEEEKKSVTKIALVKFIEGTSQYQIDDFFSSYVQLVHVTPMKSVVWGTNIGLPTSPSEGYNHTFYCTFDSLEDAVEFFDGKPHMDWADKFVPILESRIVVDIYPSFYP